MALWACGGEPASPSTQEELIFNSGFEVGSQGVPEDAILDISGIDTHFPVPNDWDSFDAHANVGDFTFQYEGGQAGERFAKIVQDPTDATNRVLQFWLDAPNVEEAGKKIKGRVQANIYNNNGLFDILHSGRFYLSEDFRVLEQAPARFTWLTVFEYWNNPNWKDFPYPFRVTIDLQKLTEEEGPLTFGVHGQVWEEDKFRSIWSYSASAFTVPIAQWIDYRIRFKEGTGSEGEFYFEVTVGSEKTIIFDLREPTVHPDNPSPDGLSHFNPMKLYTSAGLINYVNSQGRTLQVFWDDFALWKNKQP